MEHRRKRISREDLLMKGAMAGLIGAITMGIVGVAVGGIFGPSFAVPVSILTSLLGKVGVSGSETVILGAFLHMLVGSGLGVLFASLVPFDVKTSVLLGGGLLFGLVLHVVVMYGVLVPLKIVETTRRVDTWWFLAEHLVYGLTVSGVIAGFLAAGHSERTGTRPRPA